MSNRSPKQFFVYLSTEWLDSICHYSILPLSFSLVCQTQDIPWLHASTRYGMLFSAMSIGRMIGTNFNSKIPSSFRYLFTIILLVVLISAIIGIGITNKYYFLLSNFFLIGLTTSCIGYSMYQYFGSNPSLSGNNMNRNSFYNPEKKTRRQLIAWTFATLFFGTFYRDSRDIQLPFSAISLLLTLFTILVLLFYIYTSSQLSPSKKALRTQQSASSSSPSLNNSSELHGGVSSIPQVSESDLKVLPSRFLRTAGGNESKAREIYRKALQWRRDHEMNEFLRKPQRHFGRLLELYPHAIHGQSRDGCVVFYEVLGKARPRDFAQAEVTADDLVWHIILRNEFTFSQLMSGDWDEDPPESQPEEQTKRTDPASKRKTPTEDSSSDEDEETPKTKNPSLRESVSRRQVMTVLDVGGISFRDITSDVISFIKSSAEIMDNYYPGRVSRLLICNAPSWFYSAWGMVARVLPESVRKKIKIYNGVDGLGEFIDLDQRPKEYGGSGPPLGQAPEHLKFLTIPEQWKDGKKGKESPSVEQEPSPESETRTTHPIKSPKKSLRIETQIESDLPTHSPPPSSTWMSKFFRAHPQAQAADKQITPSHAYLGEKNRYVFDKKSGTWTLEGDGDALDVEDRPQDHVNSSQSVPAPEVDSPNTSTSLLEEHKLVLAIQAAHLASGGLGGAGSGSGLSRTSAGVRSVAMGGLQSEPETSSDNGSIDFNYSERDRLLGGEWSDSSSSKDHSSYSPSDAPFTKLSSHVFLLALVLYLLAATLQVGVLVLLPAWLLSPYSRGGAGYRVIDLSVVLSSAGLFLLCVEKSVRQTWDRILRASPLRALRIACGLIFLLAWILPDLLSMPSDGFALAGAAPPTSLTSYRYGHDAYDRFGGVMLDENVALRGQVLHTSLGIDLHSAVESDGLLVLTDIAVDNVRVDISDIVSNRLSDLWHVRQLLSQQFLPAQNIIWAIFPSILIASLVAGTFFARRASAILLHVAVAPALSSPHTLTFALGSLVDSMAPPLVCMMFGAVSSLGLTRPMDSSFFLGLALCVTSLLYSCTLLLSVQFRGDFGVILDSTLGQDIDIDKLEQHLNHLFSQQDSKSRPQNRFGNQSPTSQHSIPALSTSDSASCGSWVSWAGDSTYRFLSEILVVPSEDLRLLLAPPNVEYGSKLHNLKIDYKNI